MTDHIYVENNFYLVFNKEELFLLILKRQRQ